MWRRTEARLRNRPPLDSTPVAVQWAHTNRAGPGPRPSWAGGPPARAPGPSLPLAAAMTATEASSSALMMDIIAYRATAVVQTRAGIFPAVSTDDIAVYPGVYRRTQTMTQNGPGISEN